jgi:hypothetical protein
MTKLDTSTSPTCDVVTRRQISFVAIGNLIPDPQNPRKHGRAQISEKTTFWIRSVTGSQSRSVITMASEEDRPPISFSSNLEFRLKRPAIGNDAVKMSEKSDSLSGLCGEGYPSRYRGCWWVRDSRISHAGRSQPAQGSPTLQVRKALTA